MGRCDICGEKTTTACACQRMEEAEYEALQATNSIPEKLDRIIELLEDIKKNQ